LPDGLRGFEFNTMADIGQQGLSEAITSGSSAMGTDQDCIWPQGMQAQQKSVAGRLFECID